MNDITRGADEPAGATIHEFPDLDTDVVSAVLSGQPLGADVNYWTQLFPFIFLMAVSLAGAFLASLLYVQFYSSRATGSQVHRAFPLLGLSITAIFTLAAACGRDGASGRTGCGSPRSRRGGR